MNPLLMSTVILLTMHGPMKEGKPHKTFKEKCEIFNTYAGTVSNIATIIFYASKIGVRY